MPYLFPRRSESGNLSLKWDQIPTQDREPGHHDHDPHDHDPLDHNIHHCESYYL
jgi:hypothetical protein